MDRVSITHRPAWLSDWLANGLEYASALQRFATLKATEDLVGSWRGYSLPTHHPLDGLLEALGWHGKWIESLNRVHPLVFRNRSGRLVPIEPFLMPAALAIRWPGLARSTLAQFSLALGAPLLRAHGYGACLEPQSFGSTHGMALVYRSKPIVDHLRQVRPDEVVGLMEYHRMERPFFFLLTREVLPS